VSEETLPGLSAQDWALLRAHVRRAEYRRGTVIVAEGSHHRPALHIIASGAVQIEETQNGRDIALDILRPGEIFGEMGFVEQAPASASVVAHDDVVIEVIDGEALQSVMASEPGFAVRFYHSLAVILMRRLRATSRRLAQASTAEAAQIGPLRAMRTGNITARQIPPELSAGLDEFERTILSIKQGLRAGTVSEQDAGDRVSAICDSAVDVLQRFTRTESLMAMGWSDLLAFRDASQLASGVGDYVFREMFRTVMLSATMARCYTKGRGFPDDCETIAAIYANAPDGDDHLGPYIDRWFLNRPICRSRRTSRDLMQNTLAELIKRSAGAETARITSLASGVAAEILNLCETPDGACVRATCIDIDEGALLAMARRAERSGLTQRLTLLQGNAAAPEDEGLSLPPQHIIYTLGFCEYLADDQIVSLLNKACAALIPGGAMIVTNLNSTNPDRELMEHVLDWKANHRTAEELRALFAQSQFGEQPVDVFADETDVTLFARCAKAG
jgi:CRP-like cAMP-binding protein